RISERIVAVMHCSPKIIGSRGHDKLVIKPHYASSYVLKIASESHIAMENLEREYIRPEHMVYWAPTLFLRFFEVQQLGEPVRIYGSQSNCTSEMLQPARNAARLDGFVDLDRRIANFCLFGHWEPKIIDANHTSRNRHQNL